MDKHKKLLALCCSLLLIVGMTAISIPRSAHGQATIPTRTPKPEPTEDNGGGGGSKPKPTNQPAPTAKPTQTPSATTVPATAVPTRNVPTATSVTAVSPTVAGTRDSSFIVVPTSEGTPETTATFSAEMIYFEGELIAFPENNGAFPQAGPCGLPPTFTTQEAVTVYAGPGTAYPLTGLIGEDEVRPIVGRAAFLNWWLLQLDGNGRAGWISDDLGAVHGFIEQVPIINAPDLGGAAPTPGSSLWQPTPPAVCDEPEPVTGAAVGEEAANLDITPPSGKPDSLKNLYDNLMEEKASATISDQVSTAGSEKRTDNLVAELAESAQPLEVSSASASSQQLPNLLPIAGLVLLVAAIIVGVFARRSGPPSDLKE